MRKTLSFFLLLSFLLTIGFSQEQVCTTSVYEDDIIITNSLNRAQYYEVNIEGNLEQFTDLSTDEFFLDAGEQKVVHVTINFPFEKEYSLNVKIVKNGDEVVREKNYEFTAATCHLIKTSIFQDYDFCTLDNNTYSITVNNTGEYNETLNISVNDEVREIMLAPQELIMLNYTHYTNNTHDNQVFVRITNDDIEENNTYSLNIGDCDGYEIIRNQYSACERVIREQSFVFKNNGTHNNTYHLTSGYDTLILDKTLSLAPGEEQEIIFNINPTCTTGTMLEGIHISSTIHPEQVFEPINYEVRNCYDMNVRLEGYDNDDFCEGDNKTFTIIIGNNGTYFNNYYASMVVNGEQFNDYYPIIPGEEEYHSYTMNNLSPGIISLGIIVMDNSSCQNQYAYLENITVKEYSECYSAGLDIPQNFYDNNALAEITNNGTRNNSYVLRIMAYNEIDNTTFVLMPEQSATYRLGTLYDIYEEYNVTSFNIVLEGIGVNQTRTINYSPSMITGMVISSVRNASYFTGIILLLIIVYFFIKK